MVYADPGNLVVVDEIDWQHLPADLESAVLQSLRWRLVMLLAGRDRRSLPPQHPYQSAETKTSCSPRRPIPRPPLPVWATPGTRVRVTGRTPAAPQCEGRLGQLEQIIWSVHPRQLEPAPQWRALVVFAKLRHKRAGDLIRYSLPLAALQPEHPSDAGCQQHAHADVVRSTV
jgi:hypothetical protein